MEKAKKQPSCLLLFSGKRKSGKDYVTDRLQEICKNNVNMIKISLPIKKHFSEMHKLNLNELMGSSQYKEIYRMQMVSWSDEMREKQPGIFCRSAVDMSPDKDKPIWVVSDVRRKGDINWFNENYPNVVKTVRIEAEDNIRQDRGWVYTEGVDDVSSECDLDDYAYWDWKIQNNGNETELNQALSDIHAYLKKWL